MNILFVRIGRMGDVIMTLPAFHEIVSKYPQANIDVLTSLDGQRVFSLLPNSYRKLYIFRNNIPHRVFDSKRLKRQLCGRHYDKIFCFESKQRYINLINDYGSQCNLLHDNSDRHSSLKCLALVDNHLSDDLFKNKRFISCSDQSHALAKQILRYHGLSHYDHLIALHPTYSGTGSFLKKSDPDKIWSADHWVQLAHLINDAYSAINQKACIVMDLLPNEQRVGREIVAKSDGLVKLISVKPGFARYVAFIDSVDLLIAPNTGVMHLAAAVNTPVVALFSKFKASECGPFLPTEKCHVLAAEDYQTELGLDSIPPEDVADAALGLLKVKSKDRVC